MIDPKGEQVLLGLFSHVGRDNESVKSTDNATMNFGCDLERNIGVAEHEIGHALGLEHEHQHMKSKLVWKKDVVKKYFIEQAKWTKEEVRINILTPIDGQHCLYDWDPKSIMHYKFQGNMITAPEEYLETGTPENIEISEKDRLVISSMYPLPFKLNELKLPQIGNLETFPVWTIKIPIDKKSYLLVPEVSGNHSFKLLTGSSMRLGVCVSVYIHESRNTVTLTHGTLVRDKHSSVTLFLKGASFIVTFSGVPAYKSFCVSFGKN
jgi:hypothetical protein